MFAAELLAERTFGRKAAKDVGDEIVQHLVSKTLHFIKRSSEDRTVLACGRRVSERFEFLEYLPVFDWPRCRTCFGTEQSEQVVSSSSA